jgi:hypothetical protein
VLALAGAALLLAATAVAQGVDVPVDRYREAAGFRELGTVRGRAFQERRKPTGPDLPLTGTAVVLLPRSEAWLFRLQAIKREARDSMNNYRAAAGVIRRSREAYEKRLLEAGAGDLSHGATVDGDGVFALEGVPAGDWILFASRSSFAPRTPATPPQGSRGRPTPFVPPDKLTGFHVVTYWLRELTVGAGGAEAVELTDRNIWFTGVVENREAPPPREQPHPMPR